MQVLFLFWSQVMSNVESCPSVQHYPLKPPELSALWPTFLYSRLNQQDRQSRPRRPPRHVVGWFCLEVRRPPQAVPAPVREDKGYFHNPVYRADGPVAGHWGEPRKRDTFTDLASVCMHVHVCFLNLCLHVCLCLIRVCAYVCHQHTCLCLCVCARTPVCVCVTLYDCSSMSLYVFLPARLIVQA